MALPVEYYENGTHDLRMRIGNSIISYANMPVYVLSVGSSRLALVSPEMKIIKSKHNDPKLSVDDLGARLGLFDDQGGYIRMSRIPRRQVNQGINCNNTAIGLACRPKANDTKLSHYSVTGIDSSLFGNPSINALNADGWANRKFDKKLYDFCSRNEANHNLMYALTRPGFQRMWNDKYPTLKQVLNRKKGVHCMSRRHYIDTHSDRMPRICMASGRIGQIEKGRVVFDKDREYMAGDVKRTLGLDMR